jgi:hypothetical protein
VCLSSAYQGICNNLYKKLRIMIRVSEFRLKERYPKERRQERQKSRLFENTLIVENIE